MATGKKTGGRKRGTPNKTTRAFREALDAVFEKLGGEEHLLRWAKGNGTEFYKIRARFTPPGAPVCIGQLNGTLADRGKAVIRAMGEGCITPEQASTMMSAIASQARIIEIDELERRVKALEERGNGKS